MSNRANHYTPEFIRVTDQGQVIYRAEKRDCRSFPKPASASLFGDVARKLPGL